MRSDAEMLDIVHGRARRIRRRRRVAFGGASVALALVLGVGVVATRPSAERDAAVTVDGPLTTSSTAEVPRPDPSAAGPTSTIGASTTTTATAASTPSVPAPTSTPTTAAPMTTCEPTDLRPSARTDLGAYPTGQVVHVTFEVTNRSGHDCDPTAVYPVAVRNAAGGVVYSSALASSMPVGSVWRTGTNEVWTFDWYQSATCESNPAGTCSPGQVPSGTYTITGGTSGSQVSVRVTVT